ncbi:MULTISPECIES: nucleotidyltransferase family protein [Aerosakkonema]|uniref:nucleotidyltransferase domain-containing protein n=1 Tax=Aerosakkonema TaxID=1246629 RepID=UPI0035BB2FEC
MKNEQFILFILRGGSNSEVLQAAREIVSNNDINWQNLQEIIDAEALTPLLYHIVRGQDVVPASVEAVWRKAYYHNACRNALILQELGDVLHKLAAAGVDVMVIKGAALAETVYGDIAARSMSDVDLLIHPEDLATTRQILADLRYKPAYVEMQTGFTEDFRNEEIFRKEGLVDIVIDLHWRLIAPIYYQRTFTTDWFWETSLPAKINLAPAFVLSCEAQVVYLCAHLMLHHGGKSLLWLHDIAAVIDFYKQQIDWEKIIAKAKEYKLDLSVQQMLLRVADDWNAPIPAEVIEKLRALQPSRDEVRTYSWQHQTMALRLFADLAGTKDWRQGLRIAWDTLFPTREYMQQRYKIPHPFLVPLYYPYRWLRGMKRVPN